MGRRHAEECGWKQAHDWPLGARKSRPQWLFPPYLREHAGRAENRTTAVGIKWHNHCGNSLTVSWKWNTQCHVSWQLLGVPPAGVKALSTENLVMIVWGNCTCHWQKLETAQMFLDELWVVTLQHIYTRVTLSDWKESLLMLWGKYAGL